MTTSYGRENVKSEVPKRTLSSVVASQMRRRIVDGTYPPGMQLNEQELAAYFETSRAPVREGIQRLVQEGLLVSEPHRGVFVPELTVEDLDDIYFSRAAIERAAMVRISERGLSAADIAALEQSLGQMAVATRRQEWRDVVAADLRFHELIVSAARSPRLSRMYASLLGESRLGLNMLVGSFEGRADYLEEHQRIFDYLVSGDRSLLVEELESHLGTALNTLHRHYAEAAEPPQTPFGAAATSNVRAAGARRKPGGSND
ncbi:MULTISPECIES: GntR family transcriptional regulator [Arthrobacter]|uniref:GntR family transcriptional regulator n=1 Tax=Arthrobacter TaxID=1663 RepID=UPI00197ABD60|nr:MULTISPECIES: GntR family transcriptional regulator [Arthrobacter]MBT8162707.1 GntR family transcriptional regulator [Arthrobacter sp. GN70]